MAGIQCISALLNRGISFLLIAEESFEIGQAELICLIFSERSIFGDVSADENPWLLTLQKRCSKTATAIAKKLKVLKLLTLQD